MSFTSNDQDADEYEIRLHRASARRHRLVAGVIFGLAAVIFLLSGTIKVGLLVVPGMLLLMNANSHRDKANALEAVLGRRVGPPSSEARSVAPYRAAGAEVPLGRGSRVLVRWTDEMLYPGSLLQRRDAHWFVQFEDGRQEWVPSQHVRPG